MIADECEQDNDDDVDWESIMHGYDEIDVDTDEYEQDIDNNDVPTKTTKSIFADYMYNDDVPTTDDDDSEEPLIGGEKPKKKNTVKHLRFIDSFGFMASSLDKLSSNLDKSCFTNTSRYDRKQLELLLRKGVYPYEYMDSLERLAERKLQ